VLRQVAGIRDSQIQHQQGDGDGENAVTEAYKPLGVFSQPQVFNMMAGGHGCPRFHTAK
jgi:hypothetical protein